MEITQYTTTSCCGGKGTALILSKPLTREMLAQVMATGKWVEVKYQTNAGIFYIENKFLIAFGPFNKTTLEIKCKFAYPPKHDQCQQYINELTGLLTAG